MKLVSNYAVLFENCEAKLQQYDDMEAKYKAQLHDMQKNKEKYEAQLHDMHKTENQKQAGVEFLTTALFLLGIFCGYKLRN